MNGEGRHYILEGHTPMPCDFLTWARWFDAADRTVAETTVGRARISTVFLGQDHNWLHDGRPVLFESMIFGGPGDGQMMRYSSWEDAVAGHQLMVDYARSVRWSARAWADYLWDRLRCKWGRLDGWLQRIFAREDC